MFRTPRTLFRTFAFAEMVSWTLLLGGLLLRATTGQRLGVSIGGAIHGFVFLAYATTAFIVALNQRWAVGTTLLAVGSAVIPYATLPTEMALDRRGLLAGAWRRQESEHPGDRRWHDRALRWSLRHPAPLGGALVIAVVALYVVLLILGPPGGRDEALALLPSDRSRRPARRSRSSPTGQEQGHHWLEPAMWLPPPECEPRSG